MDCNICFITTTKIIVCKDCKYITCKKCYEKYILETKKLKCINIECKTVNDIDFLINNFSKTFINEYNKNIFYKKGLDNLSTIQNNLSFYKDLYYFHRSDYFIERLYSTVKTIIKQEDNITKYNQYTSIKNSLNDDEQINNIQIEIDIILFNMTDMSVILGKMWPNINIQTHINNFFYWKQNIDIKNEIDVDISYIDIKNIVDLDYKDIIEQYQKYDYNNTNKEISYFESYKLNCSNLFSNNLLIYYKNILSKIFYSNISRSIILSLCNDEKELKYLNMLDRMKNINDKRNIYVLSCTSKNCKGLVDSISFNCNICNLNYCRECYKENDIKHKCTEEDIKNIILIKQDSKNCPKCATLISKINGCDQMFCTNCKCVFSWNTLKIEEGFMHNPHYHEWIKKNKDKDTKKDVCTRTDLYNKIDKFFIYNKDIKEVFEYYLDYSSIFDSSYLYNRDKERYNEIINSYCRLYLLKKIDDKKFESKMVMFYKKIDYCNRLIEYLNIFETVILDTYNIIISDYNQNNIQTYLSYLKNINNIYLKPIINIYNYFNYKDNNINNLINKLN